jgi:hypothetical protein
MRPFSVPAAGSRARALARKPSLVPRVRDAIWGKKIRMACLHQRGRAATVLVVLASTLAALGSFGCGSSSPRRLDAADATSLQSLLAAAKWRAEHGQSAGAVEALGSFQARLRDLAAAGKLAADDARALRIGASRALATATSALDEARAQAATQPATPAPAPAPPAKENPKKHPPPTPGEHAHAKPKKHGKGGREGGD